MAIPNYVNTNKFNHIKNGLIEKYNYDNNQEEKKELISYILSDEDIDFTEIIKYYKKKYNFVNKIIIFINNFKEKAQKIEELNFENIKDSNELKNNKNFINFMNDYNLIYSNYCEFFDWYNYSTKKYQYLNFELIQKNLNSTSNVCVLKKSLFILHYKTSFLKKIYSYAKILKYEYKKRDIFFSKLNKKFNIIQELLFVNLFTKNKNIYSKDKKKFKGEVDIYTKLLYLYNNNPYLIYFTQEQVIPAKFISFLRADFFCIVVNKNNNIKKIIIEVNGDQHYNQNKFFSDINIKERDNIKMKYCNDNDIILIIIKDTETYNFDEIFCKYIKEMNETPQVGIMNKKKKKQPKYFIDTS